MLGECGGSRGGRLEPRPRLDCPEGLWGYHVAVILFYSREREPSALTRIVSSVRACIYVYTAERTKRFAFNYTINSVAVAGSLARRWCVARRGGFAYRRRRILRGAEGVNSL